MRLFACICVFLCSIGLKANPVVSFREKIKICVSGFSANLVDDDFTKQITFGRSADNPTIGGTWPKDFPKVSTYLSEEYSGRNLVDERMDSCWAYRGESAWVITYDRSPQIYFLNGLWASRELYYANNRPKQVRILGYAAAEWRTSDYMRSWIIGGLYSFLDVRITLPDKMKLIHIDITNAYSCLNSSKSFIQAKSQKFTNGSKMTGFYFKVIIESVYSGEIYNDTCISHLGWAPSYVQENIGIPKN